MIITAASFPTPELIKTTNNPGLWDQQDGFSRFQAAAANDSLAWLNERLDAATTTAERSAAFVQLYRNLAEWRYQLGQREEGRSPNADVEQYHRPIPADGPMIGVYGAGWRSEGGASIDFEANRLIGGPATPGSRMSDRLGEIIQSRFDAEAPDSDVLQNRVALPDGRSINGNLLLRGKAASTARGMPFTLEGLYATRTGAQDDRRALQQEAFRLLSGLEERHAAGPAPDASARREFGEAAYFLYQGPEYERGGDAMIRTLLVTAHARVFDEALRIPQDVDVMAHTMNQQAYAEHFERARSIVSTDAPVVGEQQAAAVRPPERTNSLDRG